MIDCSSGGFKLQAENNLVLRAPGFQLPFSEAIRGEAGLLTLGVGLIRTGEQAAVVLEDGLADLVALGREFLYNPNWPIHVALQHDPQGG